MQGSDTRERVEAIFSFFRKRRQTKLKIFFATDIHGSERCFRKFVNAAEFYGVDVLILGGDIAGKAMLPVVEQDDGTFLATHLGRENHLRTEQDAANFEKLTAEAGLYSFRVDQRELAVLESEPEERDARFYSLMFERLQTWMELAESRLGPRGVRLYFTGGNDDPEDLMAALQSSEHTINAEGGVHEIGGSYTLMSCGYGNPTPWHCPRDVSEEQLADRLAEAADRVPDPGKCIFNLHVPPIDSKLDTCPKLDTSTSPPTPLIRNGQTVLFGAGSRAVREVVERCQPSLGLHGHIHESRNVDRLGRTTCINPGSEYTEGILRGALVSLSDDGVEDYQLTSG